MNPGSDRGRTRRFGFIVCLVRGHAWETTEVTLGDSTLLQTD